MPECRLYFDWHSSEALAEFSALLGQVGIETHAHAPASVLPYNLAQRILFERYPALYRHQRSVAKDERSRKNLHVALCKLHHGISFDDHCSAALFAELTEEFVERELPNGEGWVIRTSDPDKPSTLWTAHFDEPGAYASMGLGFYGIDEVNGDDLSPSVP